MACGTRSMEWTSGAVLSITASLLLHRNLGTYLYPPIVFLGFGWR